MKATGGILTVVDRAPLPWLPERFREAMRDYLGQGILPGAALRALLEGAGVRFCMAMDPDELHALAGAQAWLEAHLPRQCWGSRDQVQLWIVYLRRARGRALLAAMEATANAEDAAATPAP